MLLLLWGWFGLNVNLWLQLKIDVSINTYYEKQSVSSVTRHIENSESQGDCSFENKGQGILNPELHLARFLKRLSN